jgi:glucan phosphoethanolaminetransferase (alkaline phosphatase superfamily)
MMKSQDIFISYAYKDEPLLREYENHLTLLQRQGVITTWLDRDIINISGTLRK